MNDVVAFDVTKPICLDCYDGDQVIDPELTFTGGVRFAFLKATEGTSIREKTYYFRRKLFLAAGFEVGAYHFYHGQNPEAEADFFVDYAEPDAGLALALDWERLRDGSYAPAKSAQRFVDRVREKAGRHKMWVYGGDVLKEAIPGHDPTVQAYWTQLNLWLAQYGMTFSSPTAWGRVPDLWQNNGDSYGPGPHTLPGMKGLVDNSRLVTGTADDLTAKWAA